MKANAVILAVALLALGIPAAAEPRVEQPHWIAKPTAAQMSAEYPRLAEALGLEGLAVIACGVDGLGMLQECKVVKEAPAGLGFGAAGVAMSRAFLLSPKMVDGRPAPGGTVRIPIRFALPREEPPQQLDSLLGEPVRMEQGREPVDLANLERSLWGRVFGRMLDLARDQDPGLDPKLTLAAFGRILEEVEAILPLWRSAVSQVHRRHLTPEDLRILSRYLELGRKTTAEAVEVEDRMGAVLQPSFEDLVQAEARRVFCLRRDCTLDQWRRAPLDQHDPMLIDPPWIQAPERRHVSDAHPLLARWLNISGVARLRCVATSRAHLQDCEAVAEAPAGLGFGPAALTLVGHFRLAPSLLSLGASGEVVYITVPFVGLKAQPIAASEVGAPPVGFEAALEILTLAGAGEPSSFMRQAATEDVREQDLPGVDAATREAAIAAFEAALPVAATALRRRAARDMARSYSPEILQEMLAVVRNPQWTGAKDRMAAAESEVDRVTLALLEQAWKTAGRRLCSEETCERKELPPSEATENSGAEVGKPETQPRLP